MRVLGDTVRWWRMTILTRALTLSVILAASGVLIGCDRLGFPGQDIAEVPTPAALSGGDRHPDVLEVELHAQGDGAFDVVVTLSSPYDTPQRYADGWRVLDPEGNVLGTHTLLHDHAGEQPFTRTQRDLRIPPDVTEVTVEGRDQANGYGGLTITLEVPES
jgi:hypothetical protein